MDFERSLFFFPPPSNYADPLIKLSEFLSGFVVVVVFFFCFGLSELLGLEFALLGCEPAASPGCV